jgi:hypothetical protein
MDQKNPEAQLTDLIDKNPSLLDTLARLVAEQKAQMFSIQIMLPRILQSGLLDPQPEPVKPTETNSLAEALAKAKTKNEESNTKTQSKPNLPAKPKKKPIKRVVKNGIEQDATGTVLYTNKRSSYTAKETK